MKCCQKHWDMLRAGCTARGMDHLLHKDGEAVIESVTKQIQGTDTKEDFDPLMAANWMITTRALQTVGLSIMETADPNGAEYCPVCIPIKYFGDTYDRTDYPTMETFWIEGVMDAVLDEARNKGLMPKVLQ